MEGTGQNRKAINIQTLKAGHSEIQFWQEKVRPFRMPWKLGGDFRMRYP